MLVEFASGLPSLAVIRLRSCTIWGGRVWYPTTLSGDPQQCLRVQSIDVETDQFLFAGVLEWEVPVAPQALANDFHGGVGPVAFQTMAGSVEFLEVTGCLKSPGTALGTDDGAVRLKLADPSQIGAIEVMNQLMTGNVNGAA